MDLLVDSTPENSARISAALGSLNLNGFSSNAFTKSGLQIPLKQTYYAELLTPQEEAPSFSEVEHQAVDAKLFNIAVRVASIRILIEMKKRAIASADEQYAKHVRDIELLERHAV
ncbi:MAG: hypothetical protein U5M53_02990 [Rhodoferax sp.]|nr:hypothetical protein [Rhodoferax sp.]